MTSSSESNVDGFELIELYLDGTLDQNGLSHLRVRLEDERFLSKMRQIVFSHQLMLALDPAASGISVEEVSLEQIRNQKATEIVMQRIAQAEEAKLASGSKTDTVAPSQPVIPFPSSTKGLDQVSNKKSKMPLVLWSVSGLAAIFCLGFFLFAQFALQDSAVGPVVTKGSQGEATIPGEISPQVARIVGDVYDKDGEQLRLGQVVLPGELIRTENKSLVLLEYPDKSTIRLTSRSELSLLPQKNKKDTAKRLFLAEGELFADVTKQEAGAGMEVKSRDGLARVVGTFFGFNVNEKYTELKVKEGQVRFDPLDGSDGYLVSSGYLARLGFGISEMSAFAEEAATFTLINVETGEPIPGFDPISDGAAIDFSELPTSKINIRINPVEHIRAAKISVNGSVAESMTIFGELAGKRSPIESFEPFSVAGDSFNEGGTYHVWLVEDGIYEIETGLFFRRNLSHRNLPKWRLVSEPVDASASITIEIKK